jgi:hypothetical protein
VRRGLRLEMVRWVRCATEARWRKEKGEGGCWVLGVDHVISWERVGGMLDCGDVWL